MPKEKKPKFVKDYKLETKNDWDFTVSYLNEKGEPVRYHTTPSECSCPRFTFAKDDRINGKRCSHILMVKQHLKIDQPIEFNFTQLKLTGDTNNG